jgi:hypothetical protein
VRSDVSRVLAGFEEISFHDFESTRKLRFA